MKSEIWPIWITIYISSVRFQLFHLIYILNLNLVSSLVFFVFFLCFFFFRENYSLL